MSSLGEWPCTPWSTILKLRADDPVQARAALRKILDTYYEPIRCYMHHHAPEEQAEEWAHAFVEKIIDEALPAKADPDKPLRHYLITAMRNFVTDQYRQGRARSRMNEEAAARLAQSADEFQQVWAELLVERVLTRMGSQTEAGAPKGLSTEDLAILRMKYGIGCEAQPHTYDAIRERLGRPCPNHEIDNALRRAKKTLVGALHAEVRLLLHSDAGLDEELWKLAQYL